MLARLARIGADPQDAGSRRGAPHDLKTGICWPPPYGGRRAPNQALNLIVWSGVFTTVLTGSQYV